MMATAEALRLFEDNQRLAYKMAHRFWKNGLRVPGMDMDDLTQEALIGLWLAAQTHDADKAEFSTYGSKCAWREMGKQLQIANYQKRKTGYHTVTLDGKLRQVLQDPASVEETATATADNAATMRNMHPRDRCIVELKAEGLNTVEIGRQLGITGAGVRLRLKEIKRRWKARA